jgi:vacuolar-type H+-ATPase subunit D/Vma8
MLKQILNNVSVELRLKKLGSESEKVRRRINALNE